MCYPNNFIREMVAKSKKEVPSEGDNKYRPLTLVLAVLYRCDGYKGKKENLVLLLFLGFNPERREW